jgi:EF-P beta-lysylation protein EpmB
MMSNCELSTELTEKNWQKILAEGFSCAVDLLSFLQLPLFLANGLAEQQFKTRVPRGFAARMVPGDPNDPLLLQVLAVDKELYDSEDYVLDPLEEASSIPAKGLIHKYHGRVLLMLTGACAINCRYCFRRHFPYQENNPGRAGWELSLDYIAQDPSIHEVILSGGDPLLATDSVLDSMFDRLEAIPHLHTLRIHSRVPVVLPERVTDFLSARLSKSRLRKVVVLHTNHPQEIDNHVTLAIDTLRRAGCFVLNQSVLLARVNDSVSVLAELSERLFSVGVLPYYLHLLDKVKGAAHFDVPLEKSLAIFRQLQSILPGYLVPRLAREEPGKKHKTLII